MAILMLKCDKNKAKAMKSLLGLYRRVLHNVNNKIYYLDELTYTTSRKHLTDLVGSLVEYETNVNTNTFYDTLYSSHKSLTLLDVLDKTIEIVALYYSEKSELSELQATMKNVDMILGRDKAQEQERSKKRMGELE